MGGWLGVSKWNGTHLSGTVISALGFTYALSLVVPSRPPTVLVQPSNHLTLSLVVMSIQFKSLGRFFADYRPQP